MIWLYYRDFNIDKTENGYRVSLNSNPNIHCHMKNYNPCFRLIDSVVDKKIPRNTGYYYLSCLARLSSDNNYIEKVNSLIKTRKSKGKKQIYRNPKIQH